MITAARTFAVRLLRVALIGLALGLAQSTAFALDLLESAQLLFFEPGDSTRVGIEVEYRNLDVKRSAALIAETLGGRVEERLVKDDLVQEIKPGGTRVWKEGTRVDTYVVGTRIGDVLIKVDTNELVDGQYDESKAVLELVTEPISEEKVHELQKAVTALEKAGARGTDLRTAVSTQVNVEMASGVRENAKVDDLLNLVRNYFQQEHYRQIGEHMRIPPIREPYVGEYSPGFMKKLRQADYKPTWRELYDDFMYRQSLEVLGVPDAWTMPIEAARARLLAMPDPMVPKVVKYNAVRISSMLMWMHPDDPLTKVIEQSLWAKPVPVVEFRGWNNTFDVVGPTRQALGLKAASARIGTFEHDRLVARQLHRTPEQLAELRASLRRMSPYDHARTARQIVEVSQLKNQSEALARFVRVNQGPPVRMGTALPESTYVPVKARNLKNAKVLYVNRERMFEKYGIAISAAGPTAAQEQAILEVVAWRIPHPNDPPEMYGDKERTFYSSRYGGDGLNGNFGSGRAMASGEIEAKGGGGTPNVSPAADEYYTKGGGPAYINEGIRETVSSAASRELPYGANEVLFIVDTGDGTRALIVREDDIRLGNITPRFYHAGDEHPANLPLHEAELKRARDLIDEQTVLKVLPIPDSAMPDRPRRRYIAGIKELARRYGEQSAAAYARGIYHGTTSASNQLASGGVIDFGSQSYHPNLAPLKMLEDSAAGGLPEAEEIIASIAPEGAHQLAPPARRGDSAALPSEEALREIAKTAYRERLRHEFLRMAGLPEALATKLKHSPPGKKAARTLIGIAEDAGGQMLIKYHTPTQMTRYNFRPMIVELAEVAGEPLTRIEQVFSTHMAGRGGLRSSPRFIKGAARDYQELMKAAAEKAAAEGVSRDAFFRLVKENSRYARVRWELNHFALEKLSNELVDEYRRTGDRRVVQRALDREIARNRLQYPDLKPYESVISVTERGGAQVSRVFDAVANKEVLVIRTPGASGGQLIERRLPVQQPAGHCLPQGIRELLGAL